MSHLPYPNITRKFLLFCFHPMVSKFPDDICWCIWQEMYYLEQHQQPSHIVETDSHQICSWLDKHTHWLHREFDFPAMIITYHRGYVISSWFYEGHKFRHRDLPAEIRTSRIHNNVIEERWLKNNRLHRDGNKPAVISYRRNGHLDAQEWWVDGCKKAHWDDWSNDKDDNDVISELNNDDDDD